MKRKVFLVISLVASPVAWAASDGPSIPSFAAPDLSECAGYSIERTPVVENLLAAFLGPKRDKVPRVMAGEQLADVLALPEQERAGALHRLMSRQACEAERTLRAYDGWVGHLAELDSFHGGDPKSLGALVCGPSEEGFWILRKELKNAANLSGVLLRDAYFGFIAYSGDKNRRPRPEEVLAGLKDRATKVSSRWFTFRGNCRRPSEEGGVASSASGAVDRAMRSVGTGERSALDRLFENAGIRPDFGNSPEERERRLTDGVVFLGAPDAEAGASAVALAQEQLIATPTGRAVYRDLQATRIWWKERNEAEIVGLEKSIVEEEAWMAARRGDRRFREEIAQKTREIAWGKARVSLLKKGPMPKIGVYFEEMGPNLGGETKVADFKEIGGELFLTLTLNTNILEEGKANPGRAVNPTLGHELRHLADGPLFAHLEKTGTRWQLTEDRAFLDQAKLMVEQARDASTEPFSPGFYGSCRSDVEELLERGDFARYAKVMGRDAYQWNLRAEDILGREGPRDAFRARIRAVFDKLYNVRARMRSYGEARGFSGRRLEEAVERGMEKYAHSLDQEEWIRDPSNPRRGRSEPRFGIAEAYRSVRGLLPKAPGAAGSGSRALRLFMAEIERRDGEKAESKRFNAGRDSRAGRSWVGEVRDAVWALKNAEGSDWRMSYEAAEAQYRRELAAFRRDNADFRCDSAYPAPPENP